MTASTSPVSRFNYKNKVIIYKIFGNRRTYLNSVQLFDLGVGISEGSAVMGDYVRHFLGAHSFLLDSAEFELGFLLVDLVSLESALHVVKNSEVLAGFLNGDDVHHAEGIPVVSSDFAVDFDETLLVVHNLNNFLSAQSVLQSASKEHRHRDALSKFVGPGGGSDGEGAS